MVASWFVGGIHYPAWHRLHGLMAGVVLAANAANAAFGSASWARMTGRGNGLLLLRLPVLVVAFGCPRTDAPAGRVG